MMGYIAPVQQLTYQQYHQRVMKEKQKPFSVDRVYPIQNNMQYDSVKEHSTFIQPNGFDFESENKRPSKETPLVVHHMFENELDEKGIFLDTKI